VLSAMTSDETPQYAGSFCVRNCSDRPKKDSAVPAIMLSRNRRFPSGDANAANAGGTGSGRRNTQGGFFTSFDTDDAIADDGDNGCAADGFADSGFNAGGDGMDKT
jgi:hypothetical protein